ncbi:MAG: hypothetical protein ACOCX3_02135 [Chloroflexota bacterium]
MITGGHTRGPVIGAAYARKVINLMQRDQVVIPDGVAFHPYGRGLLPRPNPDHPYSRFDHIKESIQAYADVLPMDY